MNEDLEVIITYGDVWSRIQASRPIIKKIDNILSPKVPGYWWSEKYRNGFWDGKIHFMKGVTNVFPSGFLPYVEKLLKRESIIYKIEGMPIPSIDCINDFNINGIELRDYQFDALCACITMQRGIIGAATNSGKTEIAATVAKCLDLKTVIFTHSKTLLYQTAERLEDRINCKVGKIGDGVWEEEKINVVMIQTMIRNLNVSKGKKFLEKMELMFVDECQHLSSNTWTNVVEKCKARYRFGLSGTPQSGNIVNDMTLIGATGPEIFSIKNIDLIKEGYSAIPKIKMIVCEQLCDGEYGEVYNKGIVESVKRNKMIVDAIDDKQTLVIVRMIEHGNILKRMCEDKGIICKFLSGGDASDIRQGTLKDFENKKINVIIASTIFDEGVDAPSIEHLILAVGGKSMIKTLQRIGRGLRKKEGDNILYVTDFIDTGNEYLLSHSEERRQIYTEEQFEVKIEGKV